MSILVYGLISIYLSFNFLFDEPFLDKGNSIYHHNGSTSELISGSSKKGTNDHEIFRSEFFAGIVFRETPYADIEGTRQLTKKGINNVNHFQFDYDINGRLVRVRYILNKKIKSFESRFVRAPHIEITYKDSMEIRTYFNEFGQRTTVSGDVYQSNFVLDRNGDRKSLRFLGLDGKEIENDFHISRYEWSTEIDGTVIEKRYDIDGNLQRNRPGFGYFITKFTYDHRGLLRLMTNMGKSGDEITPDDAGVAHTRIGYDRNSFFVQWLNLDENYNSKRGMSNIAQILYTPAPLFEHSSASFIDGDGNPQLTNWGAHIVKYTFDSHGNVLSRRYFGKKGQPINASNGIGLVKILYTEDGMSELERKYYDKDELPITIQNTQLHQIKYSFDKNGRPISKTFRGLNGQIVTDPSVGYAIEEWDYDDLNRLSERRFLSRDGKLINHKNWLVARFVYIYKNQIELKSVKYLDTKGNVKSINWNPRH